MKVKINDHFMMQFYPVHERNGKTVLNSLRTPYLERRESIQKLMVTATPRNKSSLKFSTTYVTVDSECVFELGSFWKNFSVLRSSGMLGSVDW